MLCTMFVFKQDPHLENGVFLHFFVAAGRELNSIARALHLLFARYFVGMSVRVFKVSPHFIYHLLARLAELLAGVSKQTKQFKIYIDV